MFPIFKEGILSIFTLLLIYKIQDSISTFYQMCWSMKMPIASDVLCSCCQDASLPETRDFLVAAVDPPGVSPARPAYTRPARL